MKNAVKFSDEWWAKEYTKRENAVNFETVAYFSFLTITLVLIVNLFF